MSQFVTSNLSIMSMRDCTAAMSIAPNAFDFFFMFLFLSLSCQRTARPNSGHWIQCANCRIFGIGDASPDADDAWAALLRSSPRRKPPPSRSKSAAAVPDIEAPSRIVRPPFRLFDPFSAGLLRFQPNGSSKAPVRTPVATEFNPEEREYDSINLCLPSI